MENLVYLRQAAGLPPIGEQQAILRASGQKGVNPETDRAYLDTRSTKRAGRDGGDFPERDRCIRAIRKGEGDVLHIAVPGVLAVGHDDAVKTLKRILDRGASLRVASLGLTIGPGDGVAVLEMAVAIAKDAAKARTARARAKKAEQGKIQPEARIKATALAKEMWEAETPEGYSLHTVKAIEAATGISVSTLYRAVRQGLLKPRKAQPMSIRLALANAARKRKGLIR